MHETSVSLTTDAEELRRLVYALDASVNIEILRELAKARRRGDGWMYLTQIAQKIGESPGTVGVAISKLTPFVDEKREKGLRWFRANVTEVTISARRPR